MSTLKTHNIEPATGTDVALGAAGDSITVSGDSLKLNTFKDAGGNTLFTSDGAGTLSSVNSGLKGGGPILIQTQTITSGVASVVFTSNINSTYEKYMFVCINIHPASDAEIFGFKLSSDGGSNYNVTKQSNAFQASHSETSSSTEFQYEANKDLSQSAGQQCLASAVGNDADQTCSGILYLYTPSNTTYVKHFNARFQTYCASNLSQVYYTGGYANTTSAVNAIQFTMSSGNIDAAIIKMYGIK